jgi:hypothetical protein
MKCNRRSQTADRDPRIERSRAVARAIGMRAKAEGPTRIEKSRQVRRSPSAPVSLLAVGLALVVSAGCRQDMHNQPKYRPLRASTFFNNGSSARPLVEGTIARGTLQDDPAFFTGKAGTALVTELPFPLTQDVLDRGQERYNIFCAPCHDRTGSGVSRRRCTSTGCARSKPDTFST